MWRILILLLMVRLASIQAELLRNWEYTLISSFSNISVDNVLDLDLKVVRIKRGEYALSGTIDSYVPITNDYTVAIETYYSKNGVGFTKFPLGFPKSRYNVFMDLGYKPYVMQSVKDCSNYIQYTGKWKGPQSPGHYWFNKCGINMDRIPPSYLREGYYKIRIYGENTEMVKCFYEMLVKVDKKMPF